MQSEFLVSLVLAHVPTLQNKRFLYKNHRD